jgi:hypothetical protein
MTRNFCKTSLLVTVLALVFTVTLHSVALAQEPSGTVEIDEYQLAYIFNGNIGGGKLYFQGNTYDFKIGGVGIGGIGASHITAQGNVYNLTDVSQFAGTFAQAGVGISATNVGAGHLWLQNQNGVQLHLKASQEGLGLTTGADGVVIMME